MKFLYLLLAVSTQALNLTVSDTVNLTLATGYENLHDCAYCCLDSNSDCNIESVCVAQHVNCTFNECLCSTGTLPKALEYISSCVSANCAVATDVDAYQQVFETYCQEYQLAILSSSLSVAISTSTPVPVSTSMAPTITTQSKTLGLSSFLI
jgi:hypothetical protein